MIKKLLPMLLLFSLLILHACSQTQKNECNLASDCPKGACPDGYQYNKFSCSENKCVENQFFADPCLNHYEPINSCSLDSDCATGGCSGQVCGNKDDVKSIITTCEFREEYSCLRLTKCSCISSKCEFEPNQAYKDCLASIE